MIVASTDGWALAFATVFAALIAATVPAVVQVRSNRKTRERLGKPNGGGSVSGDIAELKREITTAKDDLRRDLSVVSTTATAALAVSEANGTEVNKLRRQLDKHLEIHGCEPLKD